jgi:hypothetical protein
MNRHLNSEGLECNTGHVRGSVIVGGGGEMKRVKEGEYG